jgi:hypothetical protein
MKTPQSNITADDLRSERTWLLQHGKQELMDGGMSSMEANNAIEKQVTDLGIRIEAMESSGTAKRRYEVRKGVNMHLLLMADDFGTIWGQPEGADAMERAGYIASCGVGYTLTALGREVRIEFLKKGGAS